MTEPKLRTYTLSGTVGSTTAGLNYELFNNASSGLIYRIRRIVLGVGTAATVIAQRDTDALTAGTSTNVTASPHDSSDAAAALAAGEAKIYSVFATGGGVTGKKELRRHTVPTGSGVEFYSDDPRSPEEAWTLRPGEYLHLTYNSTGSWTVVLTYTEEPV